MMDGYDSKLLTVVTSFLSLHPGLWRPIYKLFVYGISSTFRLDNVRMNSPVLFHCLALIENTDDASILAGIN